jgi:signal transduction histidine kinase
MVNKILTQRKPQTTLIATFVIFLMPFLMVMFFPIQLDKKMDASSYLVFHNVAEFFSIMVSLSLFSIGWYTYDQSKDRHALFLGTAFLAVGLIDFMHTMSNAAMPDFVTQNSTLKSTQFWIAARLLDASALMVSAFIYPETQRRWLSKNFLITASLCITGLLFIGVTFFPAHLPSTFVPGVGLTPFKRYAELTVVLMLIVAAAAYWRRMSRTGDRLIIYYLTAFIICIFSELVFASYKTGFDTYNVLGHIYKIMAYYLIYRGIFVTSVNKPYIRLSEAHAKLSVYAERLERANRDLLDFSFVTAHDFQEPLRKIHTFGGRLLSKFRDSIGEDGQDCVMRMVRSADRMSALFKSLLAYSHVASRTNPFRPVDLRKAARDAVNECKMMIEKAGGRVEIGELPIVEGDAEQIGQLFQNLISNSIRYCSDREKPVVKIYGRTAEPKWYIYVEDNGIGFEDIYLDRIFRPFQRLHGQHEYEGTGMGLALCRKIVEQHGGGITARSVPGKGSTFIVDFPMRQGEGGIRSELKQT